RVVCSSMENELESVEGTEELQTELAEAQGKLDVDMEGVSHSDEDTFRAGSEPEEVPSSLPENDTTLMARFALAEKPSPRALFAATIAMSSLLGGAIYAVVKVLPSSMFASYIACALAVIQALGVYGLCQWNHRRVLRAREREIAEATGLLAAGSDSVVPQSDPLHPAF